MNAFMVRSIVKDESAAELGTALDRLFAAIRREEPKGVNYTSYRLADGVTYVALLELEDGVENPLPGLAEFREFQDGLHTWLAEPPSPEPLTVAAIYRSF